MYESTSGRQNGIESSTTLVADGGIAWSDLTAFQRDLLREISRIEGEGDTPYGLAVRDRLQPKYATEVNHGRLYPNLDTLVTQDLIEKGKLDNRTNTYKLTTAGRTILRAGVEDLADACGMNLAATDGGDGK